MEFGTFILNGQRDPEKPPRLIYAEMVEQVRLAEQAGFSVAWLAEHHFANYCLTPSPLAMINYLAALTSRIRLGPAVIVAPLYEPLRLLEDIAVADQLSDGRLVLGLGSGYQRYEFGKFGVDLATAKERLLETLDIIDQLYRNEFVRYDGRHVRIPETHLAVRPLRRTPEIVIAGHAFAGPLMQRMAERGYTPFISAGWSAREDLAKAREGIVTEYLAAGGVAEAMPLALQMHVHVCDSREEQLRAAEGVRYIRRIAYSMRQPETRVDKTRLVETPSPSEPTLETIAERARVGSAEKVASQLVEDIRLLHPSHISCVFNVGGGLSMTEILKGMELFAGEVVPLIERELGPLAAIGTPAKEGSVHDKHRVDSRSTASVAHKRMSR